MLQYVVPEVKELYNWLEVDFHPLKLSGRVTKVNHLAVKMPFKGKYSIYLFKNAYVAVSGKKQKNKLTFLLGVELGQRPG